MPDAVHSTTPPTAVAPARRPWTLPHLAELPKLTSLTLASLIGGGGGTGGGGSTVFGLLLALLALAGCSADRGTGPSDGLPAPVKMQAVTCQATIATGKVTCAVPQAAGGREILGGQGQYVALRSSNVTAAAGLFSADVTVQNLAAQPLGTDDGTNQSGVFVFFQSGPTVTGGTGSVTVANGDGMGNFTSPGQIYFKYDTILGGLEESAAATWEWNYDPTVTAFAFTVLVAADVPEVGGVLRWSLLPGMEGVSILDVAANGPTDVMAVGDAGYLVRRTGSGWRASPDPLPGGLVAVTAVGSGGFIGVGAVPNQDGYVARFNGVVWTKIHTLLEMAVTDVYGAPTGEIFVSGYDRNSGEGKLGWFDGTLWHDSVVAGAQPFRFADGTGETNVVVVSLDGLALHWDGTIWTEQLPGGGPEIRALHVTGPKQFILGGSTGPFFASVAFVVSVDDGAVDSLPVGSGQAVGGLGTAPGGGVLATVLGTNGFFSSWTLFRKWDGVSWTTLDSTAGTVFGNPGDDGTGTYYLPSEYGVLSWEGTGTSLAFGGEEVPEFNGLSVVGDHVFLATDGGGIRHYDGATWNQDYLNAQYALSVWAFSETDVYVATDSGVFHFDGIGWSLEPVDQVGMGVAALWGTGSTLFGIKGDTLFEKSGGTWSAHTSPILNGQSYYRVWGTGPSAVFIAGPGYDLKYWDGNDFSNVPLPDCPPADSLFLVEGLGGTAANDIWIGTDDRGVLHWNGASITQFGTDELGTAGAILPTGTGQAYIGTTDGVFQATVGGVLRPVSSAGLDGGVGLAAGSGGRIWGVGFRSLFVGIR
jgi:hypothetical protein